MCKSRVYDAVQAAAERVPGLKREKVFERIRTPAWGGNVTSVQVKGKWFPLGLTMDDTTGLMLTVDALSGESAVTLQEWVAVGSHLAFLTNCLSLCSQCAAPAASRGRRVSRRSALRSAWGPALRHTRGARPYGRTWTPASWRCRIAALASTG
jgi:hypothetical protein